MLLCGFSVQDALQSGGVFFQKIVYPDDLDMIQEIWDATQTKFSLFDIPQKFKTSLTLSYRLNHRSSLIAVDHSLTPMSLNEQGEMRTVISLVSISSQAQPGNVFLECGDDKCWEYSFKLRKWQQSKSVSFSDREKEILLLSAQGMSNKEIAEYLFIDITTVKSHKYNLFHKLKAKNICKAIGFLNKGNFFR